jgi:hypothetical protein
VEVAGPDVAGAVDAGAGVAGADGWALASASNVVSIVAGTAKLNAAANPRRENRFRREIILRPPLPHTYFVQNTFMVRFDSDQVAPAQSKDGVFRTRRTSGRGAANRGERSERSLRRTVTDRHYRLIHHCAVLDYFARSGSSRMMTWPPPGKAMRNQSQRQLSTLQCLQTT